MTHTLTHLPADHRSLLELSLIDLATLVSRELAGKRDADGKITWLEGEDQVEIDPGSLKMALKPGLVLFQVVQADAVRGLGTLMVALGVGASKSEAGLAAVTETLPRGPGALAARWGGRVQEALWRAVAVIGQGLFFELCPDRLLALEGVYTEGHQLSYVAKAFERDAPEG